MQTTLVDSGFAIFAFHMARKAETFSNSEKLLGLSGLFWKDFSLHTRGRPLALTGVNHFYELGVQGPALGFMMVLAFARCVYGFSTIVDRLDSVQFLLSKPRAKAFPVYIPASAEKSNGISHPSR
jgi:hypothetical protein